MAINPIQTCFFGDIPVRFVLLKDKKAVFVSTEDIFNAIKSCLVGVMREISDKITSEGKGGARGNQVTMNGPAHR